MVVYGILILIVGISLFQFYKTRNKWTAVMAFGIVTINLIYELAGIAYAAYTTGVTVYLPVYAVILYIATVGILYFIGKSTAPAIVTHTKSPSQLSTDDIFEGL